MNNQFKYLGYPKKNGYPHYAFFDVVLGRFVFVCDNLDTAIDLHVVSLPRYHTEIVQLDCAENYSWNCLDNDVCEYWSYHNAGQADHWEASDNHVIRAEHLTQDSVLPTDADVVKLCKTWFQVHWHWINFIKKLPELIVPNYNVRKIASALSAELSSTFQNQMTDVEHHRHWIINQLLLQTSAQDCHDVIGSYVRSNNVLASAYFRWQH